jgi:hypothetical protein
MASTDVTREDRNVEMRVLKRSRKAPRAGDVFVFQLHGSEYYFGRVICTSARHGSTNNLYLLYFYDTHRLSKLPVPALARDRLLFPPIVAGRELWTSGYLETVANVPLQEGDTFSVHCFESAPIRPGGRTCYVDEYDNPLERRYEPCSVRGMTTIVGVNNRVKRALRLSAETD